MSFNIIFEIRSELVSEFDNERELTLFQKDHGFHGALHVFVSHGEQYRDGRHDDVHVVLVGFEQFDDFETGFEHVGVFGAIVDVVFEEDDHDFERGSDDLKVALVVSEDVHDDEHQVRRLRVQADHVDQIA